jgi:hypothetical protein
MRRIAYRTAVIAVGTMLFVMPGGTSAMAAPSSEGATVYDINQCYDYGGGEVLCLTGRGVLNYTQTPTGLLSVTNQTDVYYSSTGGSCEMESRDQDHVHGHVKLVGPDTYTTHEIILMSRQGSVVRCGDFAYSCDEIVIAHYMQDENFQLTFQVNRYEYSCTEL